ncbi:MAG: lipopolysaccharide biosynthesis protein [Holophagaceae bacterium]|nr:lipopolysaccharide biosynthesis protein [Holophagaceae bacterium]
MSVRDLFRKDPTLKKAIAWGLLAGVLTAAYTLTMPNRYRSEAMVLPKNASSNSPLAALAATAAMLGAGRGQTDDEAHYADIVKSRWMAERLLDTEFTFSYKSWYFGEPRVRKQTLAAFLKAGNPEKRESAAKVILDWVEAKRDLKSGVLRISAEAPSPELSQQLANRVTDLLGVALKTRIQTQGTAKAAYAKERLIQARQEEEQARQELETFARSHINFAQSPDPGVRFRGERLGVDMMLRRQVVASLTLGYEQAELEAQNTVPVLSRLDEAYLPVGKSGPRRSSIVLTIILLGGGAVWVGCNLSRIRSVLRTIEARRTEVNG